MKKLLVVSILLFGFCMTMNACAPEKETDTTGGSTTPPAPDPIPDPQPGAGRYLTVYFSLSGNTETAATELNSRTGGTIIEITPQTTYPDDYNATLERAREEIASIDDEGVYPAIETIEANLDDYDVVFICTPLWYARMATPMQSFLHANSAKLASKQLALLVTSSSSGISSVEADARRLCPYSEFIGEALWIRNSQTDNAATLVGNWLESLNIDSPDDNNNDNAMTVSIGQNHFEAALAENPTAHAFAGLLPLTIEMNELNGNEKYFYLPESLPSAASRPETINAGDLMLYGEKCIVLFYETFTSTYSYTRIGHIEDASGLAAALGTGRVTVNFNL